MAYELKKNLANRKNYGSNRSTKDIKYIVLHFTANDGDTDENNGNYFDNNVVYASAHYFVDGDSVTQSVPDNYVAYSVGGRKYANCSETGGGKLYGKCTNANSLSIEICDDVKNGTIYPSAKTIANAIELTKAKMKEYGIPAANVIRHFDVNGKGCPGYWCGTAAKNAEWKTEFWNKLTGKTAAEPEAPQQSVPEASNNTGGDPGIVFTYAVRLEDGRALPEVSNLEDYAGIRGKRIADVKIKANKGSVRYRVHVLGGGWLPYVTGYNWGDHINGYAGNGMAIDAIEVYYYTPADMVSEYGYQKAKYRVSPVNGNYYPWQYDDEIGNGQDGYAGTFRKAMDRFQLC